MDAHPTTHDQIPIGSGLDSLDPITNDDHKVGLLVNDTPYEITQCRHDQPPVTRLATITEEYTPLMTLATYTDDDYGTSYAHPVNTDVSSQLPNATESDDDFYYFDPNDYDHIVRRDQGDRQKFGKPIHFDLKHGTESQGFIRDTHLDCFLDQLTDHQLFGKGMDTDSATYYLHQATASQECIREIRRQQDLSPLPSDDPAIEEDDMFHDCLTDECSEPSDGIFLHKENESFLD